MPINVLSDQSLLLRVILGLGYSNFIERINFISGDFKSGFCCTTKKMEGKFFLATAVLLGLSLLPPESAGYCWQAGWNPGFEGPPAVRQVSLDRVRVSWEGTIKNRECADQGPDSIEEVLA